ncbi:MAG: mechanosensitive ion channel family protein [Firmicutes bacterium]|nr:mechanosensitive ion channel family protein [Bacillota bacterium]
MEGTLFGTAFVEMSEYLNKVPGALFTLIIGALFVKVARMVVLRATSATHVDPTLASLLGSGVGFVGWIFVLAAVTAAMGMQQISLALGGSVALVAMALASGMNSVTQDLLAGVFLIADDDFRVGYKVKATGLEGIVESVTIRKTKIRDDDGILHTVPNRLIDNATYTLLDRGPEQEALPAGRLRSRFSRKNG